MGIGVGVGLGVGVGVRVRLHAKPLHVVELCDQGHHLLLRALVTLLCHKARRLRARGVMVRGRGRGEKR